jgi:hypothetical protein
LLESSLELDILLLTILTLEIIYYALMHPYLTYGLTVWGQACKTDLNQLLVLQKRAVRLINFGGYRDHAIPFFIKSNILPLDFLYFLNSACTMHNIINNESPVNIASLFTSIADTHNYSTRSAARGNLYLPSSRLNVRAKSFSRIGVKVWNSLPPSDRRLSKSSFSKGCKSILFDALSSSDDYIDLTQIMQTVSDTLMYFLFD